MLSFVLSILVVTIHAYNIETYSIESGVLYWIEKYENTFAGIAVLMFFALSGYLFFQNYTPEKLLDKWKNRVFSVLIPYLLWNGIAYLFYQGINIIPVVRSNMVQEIEPFSILELFRNMIFGGHNVTWFLQNLMVYIVVTPLLYFLLKRKIGAILIWFTVFGLALITNNTYLLYWVIYISGAIIGIHLKRFVDLYYSKTLVIVSAVYLISTMLILTIFEINEQFIIIPIRLTQISAAWIFSDIFSVSGDLKWWMRISFFIYCSHSMILELLEKVFLIVFGNNILGAFIDFFVAPIITLLIIIMMAHILRKVKPVWGILTGNRQ